MPRHVVVVNGGSSSGKTSIARQLQRILPEPWLRFGVDELIDAMPPSVTSGSSGIEFGAAGEVAVGPAFRALESAWMTGLAATAHAGARIIVDDVFLSGRASQDRWRAALDGLEVLWVGVRCEPSVAAEREERRGDRTAGMATSQADTVHDGVTYDVEVDTTTQAPEECARLIASHLT